MRMRITGNVWRDGRVLAIGAEVELPEPECERLAVLGVADPAPVPAPTGSAMVCSVIAVPEPASVAAPKSEPVAVESSEKPKRRRRK